MMKCHIYADGGLIGWAKFVHFDPGMGVSTGPFVPNEDYAKFQPIFRDTTLRYGSVGEARSEAGIESWRKAQAFNLTARTVAGETLEPQGGITIFDYSEELEDDAMEVHLLGLPRETSEKYFQEAIGAYYQYGGNRMNHSEKSEARSKTGGH
ncbi:MAG: hypothetical protein JO250_11975 [Armatimonadetes bacterium]|nr:hypothetical protein [Armatimonadota bacterium]